MKLVFYSGGQSSKNKKLHGCLSDLVDRKKGKSMTYIPFCADGAGPFYRRAIERYRPYGFTRFHTLSVDTKFTRDELKRALDSDVIYLAGGNTFYFLMHLRKAGLMTKLRDYSRDGGVIAGLSAGGLILTPNIGLAGYPSWEADENEVGLQDLRALGLVDFEFFPHFDRSPRLRRALLRYSRKTSNPILTAHDGGGIIVNGKFTTLLGHVNMIADGEIHRIS